MAGTRVTVSVVLDCLAAGMGESDLAEYRSLTAEGIRAAAAFGAASHWPLPGPARASADDADGDAEVVRRPGQESPDVGFGPEPKRSAVEKAGREGLGHKQAAAVAGGQGGGLVEEGAGVENLEHLWMRVPHDLEVPPGKGGEALGKLAAAGGMNSLEEPPVAAGREG